MKQKGEWGRHRYRGRGLRVGGFKLSQKNEFEPQLEEKVEVEVENVFDDKQLQEEEMVEVEPQPRDDYPGGPYDLCNIFLINVKLC